MSKKFAPVAALAAAYNSLAQQEGKEKIKFRCLGGKVFIKRGLKYLYEGIVRTGGKWAESAQQDRLEACIQHAGRNEFDNFDERILAALGE